jgi:hypothetical protein
MRKKIAPPLSKSGGALMGHRGVNSELGSPSLARRIIYIEVTEGHEDFTGITCTVSIPPLSVLAGLFV